MPSVPKSRRFRIVGIRAKNNRLNLLTAALSRADANLLNGAENSEDIKKVLGCSEGIKNIIIDDETGIAEILYIPELISVDDMKRTIYEIGYRAD